MVEAETAEWAALDPASGARRLRRGNIVFSLTDHAQNGFFNAAEWIPVVSSAFAIGFLLVPFAMSVGPPYLRLCGIVLGAQALVGVMGSGFHVEADLHQPGANLFEQVLIGAPPLAPLLFPNLVVLGCIALWAMSRRLLPAERPARL